MKTILRFFTLFISIFFFSGFAYYTHIVSYVMTIVAYPILKMNGSIVEPLKKGWHRDKVIDDREFLVRQNSLLHMQNIRLRSALAYLENIKELSAFNKRYEEQGYIAQVIARNFTGDAHYFLIDVGKKSGIAKDMVVLYKNSLIGKIAEVYQWYSKVCLVTDRSCKVAAFCAQTCAKGIYEGCNTQTTALRFVNHLSKVQEGDLILSSGEGLIFPAGFALGRISSCSTDGLYKIITAEPLCDLREIDYCVVMAKG